MTKVLCIAPDERRAKALAQAVALAGAEAVTALSFEHAVELASIVQVAVGAGALGREALERLNVDRPQVLRIAIIDSCPSDEILDLMESFHPWALLWDPPTLQKLAEVIRQGVNTQGTIMANEDATHRFVRQTAAPTHPTDFLLMTTDRLTGTLRPHYFRLRLAQELERATRYRRPLSLLLIDIDDLRALSDRYGRAVGEMAIQMIATTVLAGARAVDLVGRWASGSFVLVLPETDPGAAYAISERLRSRIASERLLLSLDNDLRHRLRKNDSLRISISCGVATLLQDGIPCPQTLIARADAALYRAKQSGRNRSVADG